MAGDVKVAVVSGVLDRTTNETTDFTKSGFGTPKACIVILSLDFVDNTSVAVESRVSIGFSDFTKNFCIIHQDEDASAKVDCDSRKQTLSCYGSLNVSGTIENAGTASAITDGVRLTNASGDIATDPFVTVIMFGGADLKVSLDSVAVNSSQDGTTATTTNIDQDLVFFIGTDIAAENSSSSGIENSFGVAHIDTADHATFVNRCMGWSSDHNNTIGSPSAVIRNDRCLKILTEVGGDDWGLELTAATTTAYTITTRDNGAGTGMEIYALALDLDDRKSKVGSVNSPTSGTSWTPAVSLGFTPQYVGLGLFRGTSENNIQFDFRAGSHGISSNSGSGEETCHSWYNEDGSAATNTNNLFRSRAIDFRDDDVTTVTQDHSHSSFNNGDWTYTINSISESVATKWFYWTIEEAAAADNDITRTPPAADLTLSATAPAILHTQKVFPGAADLALSTTTFPLHTLMPIAATNLTLSTTTFPLSTLLPIAAADLALSTTIPTVTQTLDILLTIPRADLQLTTTGPTLHTNLPMATADLQLSTTIPTITQTFDILRLPEAADLALTTSIPAILQTQKIEISSVDLQLTTVGFPLQTRMPVTAADLTITTTAPTILHTQKITVSAADLVLTTTAFPLRTLVPVPADNLLIDTSAPDIVQTGDHLRSIPAADLVLTTVAFPLHINLPIVQADLQLDTTIPVILQTFDVLRSVPSADLTLTTTSFSQQIITRVPQSNLQLTTTAPSVQIVVLITISSADLQLTTSAVTQQILTQVTSANLTITTTAFALATNLPIAQADLQLTTTVPTVTQTFDVLRSVPAADLVLTTTSVTQQILTRVVSADLVISTTGPVLRTNLPIAAADLVLTTAVPVLQFAITIPSINLTITTTAPVLQTNLAIPSADLALTTTIPTVLETFDVLRLLPSADLALSTTSPVLATIIRIPSTNLVITTTAPTIAIPGVINITPANANLVLSTTAPTAQVILQAFPAAAQLVLSTTAPNTLSPIIPASRITTPAARAGTLTIAARTDCVVGSSDRTFTPASEAA